MNTQQLKLSVQHFVYFYPMKKWSELCLTEIEDGHVKAILELQYANYQYVKWVEQVLKPYNISNEQFNVLKVLAADYPRLFSLKDVQQRLPNQTKNTTRLVEKLKQKGWVSSQINPDNKRQLQITITAEGLKLIKDIDVPFGAFIGNLKSCFTAEEAQQLSQLLAKFYAMQD